jgi:Tfp pilus assembly protein PilF
MSQRALYLAPDNYSYIDTHAWVLHCLGRSDEAKTLMRQALSLSSQRDPDILAHYGDILWSLGEHFLAETYWEKAVDSGYDAQLMEERRQKLMK